MYVLFFSVDVKLFHFFFVRRALSESRSGVKFTGYLFLVLAVLQLGVRPDFPTLLHSNKACAHVFVLDVYRNKIFFVCRR